jgi:hypothetical protein
MSWYTWAWIFWLAFFAVIEGVALFDKDRGDTLSEHIWAWFKIKDKPRQWTARRAVLAVFMVWLTVHMVAGI